MFECKIITIIIAINTISCSRCGGARGGRTVRATGESGRVACAYRVLSSQCYVELGVHYKWRRGQRSDWLLNNNNTKKKLQQKGGQCVKNKKYNRDITIYDTIHVSIVLARYMPTVLGYAMIIML